MVRFLCCQPATLYYAWQVEVMLWSFLDQGVNLNQVDVVCSVNSACRMDLWSRLAEKYPARFFFYKDDRPQPLYYISSVRPWILAKHFADHPYLKNETILYHDCDIALTKPIDLAVFSKGDKWYGSDVRWYIGHDYIVGKGEDVLLNMCDIVGIDPQIVKDNELNCIGAQYLMKDIDSDYWLKVYRDSESLFKNITELNNIKKKNDPSYHPLQIWCADMWAVLWNAWLRGKETFTHKDFEFSWGTSTEDDWNSHAIFHNAGVTGPDQGLFYKGMFMNETPFNSTLTIKDETASARYYDLIKSRKSVIARQ